MVAIIVRKWMSENLAVEHSQCTVVHNAQCGHRAPSRRLVGYIREDLRGRVASLHLHVSGLSVLSESLLPQRALWPQDQKPGTRSERDGTHTPQRKQELKALTTKEHSQAKQVEQRR